MVAIRCARELGITFFDTADGFAAANRLGIVLSRYRQTWSSR
jgi:aryl-alcohol dehydrogenase-like predicted oxidoreductase